MYISTYSTAILLYGEGFKLHIRNSISSVVGRSRDLVKYGGLLNVQQVLLEVQPSPSQSGSLECNVYRSSLST